MAIGTGDGEHFEDAIAHKLSQFEDKGVTQSPNFKVGSAFEQLKNEPVRALEMPPQASERVADAFNQLPRYTPTEASLESHPRASKEVVSDVDLPKAGDQYAMMEGMKIPGVNIIRGGESEGGGGIIPMRNPANENPKGQFIGDEKYKIQTREQQKQLDEKLQQFNSEYDRITESYRKANEGWKTLQEMDKKLKDIERKSKFKIVPKE